MRKVPVFSPAQIANLAPARAIVFRRGIDPVLGRARMAWRRRDVRATTAGYPAAAAAPGVRARLLYTRLVTVDRGRAAMAAVRAGAVVVGKVVRSRAVAEERLRFWWRRLRPATWARRRAEKTQQQRRHAGLVRPWRRPEGEPRISEVLQVPSQRVVVELEPAEPTADQAELEQLEREQQR